MTIKVTITHDEPTGDHNILVGCLQDRSGYDHPQMSGMQEVTPGKSVSVYVYPGQRVQVWQAPLAIELKVADEIERAMNDPMQVGAPSALNPRLRIKVAQAAIAAANSVLK